MAETQPLPRMGLHRVPDDVKSTLWERLRLTAQRWLVSEALHCALGVFISTRLFFALLTYFGVILFNSSLHGAHPSFMHQLLPAWNNPVSHGWDTQWYIDVAQRGYDWKKAGGTSPTAFFPLYPLLIHVVVSATHRSYLVVAMAISNVAFLAALVYLWRLAEWEFDRSLASRTVLYIAVFPTALFYFAGYAEALFLLCTVGCFFHLRRRDWLLAGLFAASASATRVTRILLLLPLVYAYMRDRNFSVRNLNDGAFGLILAPLGLLGFMGYLAATVGDPLAFTHSQSAWQKVFTLRLWSGFTESVRQIAVLPPASFMQAHNIINLCIAGLFLAWSVLAARRLPAPYTLYVGAFWLVALTSPAISGGYQVPLISFSRYVVTLFPVFFYMGLLGNRRWFHDALLVISVGLLSVFTLQFINGGWII